MTALTDEIRRQIKSQLTAKPGRKEIRRRIIAVEGGVRRTRSKTGSTWPFHSESLGVNPEQIAEAKEEMERNGVSCDFDEEGRAIITGPAHYRKVAKAAGMFDGAHGFVQRNEDDKVVFTGKEGVERKKEMFRQMREYADGGQCDPHIERMLEQMARES